jgi:hypothetical protein
MAAADPSNHDKLGFADLVGRRNLAQFRAGVEEEPTKKWKLKQQFEPFWLATSNENFYNFSKSGFHFPVTPNKRN